MKQLAVVPPTPEQLPIVTYFQLGALVIRGAAGSGKTSTALLRLRQLAASFDSRRQRLHLDEVRILVLTYNRTLRGYIQGLVNSQVQESPTVSIEVSTFAKWAMRLLGVAEVIDSDRKEGLLTYLGRGLGLATQFLSDEIDYVLGRFLPSDRQAYLVTPRDGRGAVPRVDRQLRQRILDEVVDPYLDQLRNDNVLDWNDLAANLILAPRPERYDVIVVDESQDLSANQIRAITAHLARDHSVTFVLDGAQRIYPRFYSWAEVGVIVSAQNSFRLAKNYRNTLEIAAFARPIIAGIDIGADGSLPDLASCARRGARPRLIVGPYLEQVEYAISWLRHIDLSITSVAFLHPKGWFRDLKPRLREAGLAFVGITRDPEWPTGDENIALSTFHSAKGLEFDHVVILGFDDAVTPHGADPEDEQFLSLRRLLAVAVTRARETVTIGYKAGEASSLLALLDPATFDLVEL